ncbi:MAG: hypothetical protein H8D97_00790 [Proteobacteria bacterium]|nr:hypothetical protein [Pseudomonadota bacterium]
MDIDYVSKSSKAVDNLTTREAHIIHVVPDFKSNLVTHIKNSLGIRPNSIHSIVAKSGTMKIAGKSFNSGAYIEQLKVLIKQRKINIAVQTSLPSSIPKGKFVVIDHSIISQAIGYVNELASPKQALYFLFQKLKNDMMEVKSKIGLGVKQSILFPLNKFDTGLIELLDYLKQISVQELNTDYNAFDDSVFISISLDEKKISVIPIMGYNLKGNVEIYKNNISKSKTTLKNLEKSQLKQIATDKMEKSHSKNKQLSRMADVKIDQNVEKTKDGFYKPIIEINQKKLNSILRGYKIKDMTIANNIKSAIDKYLQIIQPRDNINLDDKENLEQVILKSIHFSIFQTDKIREEFLHDPGALIKKLIDINIHSKDLILPKITEEQMIDPQKIVGINSINNIRHEYELDDNIHGRIEDLFKSLESKKSAPIKILSIKHDYKDDNLNRFIEYTVRMKNLTGGEKSPYEIKMKVPSLVNNRYLKLNGSEYILLSQQYLTPLTKDKANEARLLTHFQMTRLATKNMKFNISQIDEIVEYIETRYPELIKKISKDNDKLESVEFQDGTIIQPREEVPFQRYDKKLIRDGRKFVIEKRDEKQDLNIGKNEFLFDELLKQIQSVNKDDKLTTSKRSIPYIQVNIVSRKIPLVFFLWQQQGLIESMINMGVDFEISTNSTKPGTKHITMKLEDGKFLFIYPENRRQELVFNGLMQFPKQTKIENDQLSDRHALDSYLNDKFGSKTTSTFDIAVEKMIDPTTTELLKFYEYPDNYLEILTEPLLEKLLNDEPDHPADLKNLRVRQAEVFAHTIYNQLSIAHNTYVEKVNTGNEDAKIRMDENYVINNLMGRHRDARNDGGALLEFVAPFSPIDELIKTAKTVKTGLGGIPNKQAFRKEQRTIHPSYIGNIAAHSTGEQDAGGWNSHTLGVMITNKYGNYGGKKPDPKTNNWDSLGIDEALIPFVHSMNSDRLIMA